MSRTYKDRPSNIQARDPRNRKVSREYHFCGPQWAMVKYKTVTTKRVYSDGFYTRKIGVLWSTEWEDCTLHETMRREGRFLFTGCRLVPVDRSDWTWQYSKFSQDARDFYNGVQRTERRVKTKKMVDEYNACGIIEDDYVFEPYKKKGVWD